MPGGGVELIVLAAAALNAPLLDAAHQLGPPWHDVGLPKPSKPHTRYGAVMVQGRPALEVRVQSSYSNWVHDFKPAVVVHQLRWSWRLDQGNAKADLEHKSGDDVPLRLCLSFGMPIERVPFTERQMLRIAQAVSGLALPTATLCYVWDHRLPHGTLLHNAFTHRVRQIVLRNGGDSVATWFDEVRDVAADFRRAFGDESAELPPVTALIVSGDGDNTQASSLGYVADLRAEP